LRADPLLRIVNPSRCCATQSPVGGADWVGRGICRWHAMEVRRTGTCRDWRRAAPRQATRLRRTHAPGLSLASQGTAVQLASCFSFSMCRSYYRPKLLLVAVSCRGRGGTCSAVAHNDRIRGTLANNFKTSSPVWRYRFRGTQTPTVHVTHAPRIFSTIHMRAHVQACTAACTAGMGAGVQD
jgi:hypothetical protein